MPRKIQRLYSKMKVKTATFNGRKYKIDLCEEPLDGYCDQYKLSESQRTLCIWTPLDKRNGLITAIHEALHASDWHASEETVDRISNDMGRSLWRLGYRRVK